MEQDLERLSVGSQNNEFSDAAIECFGGYWYSKENKYNHTQRMYERAWKRAFIRSFFELLILTSLLHELKNLRRNECVANKYWIKDLQNSWGRHLQVAMLFLGLLPLLIELGQTE